MVASEESATLNRANSNFLNTHRIAALRLPRPLPKDLLSLEALIDLPWWAGSEATKKMHPFSSSVRCRL